MNRWLKIILVTLVMVLKGAVNTNAATFDNDSNVKIYTWVAENNQKQQASISDSSHIYRICSSRPERVVPTNYFVKQGTKQGRKLLMANHNNYISAHQRGRNHFWVSRLMLELPCEYYVFALKRLIC